MNLEKAIEIAENSAATGEIITYEDYADAIRLLIQAAIRIQFYRKDKMHVANHPLQGETVNGKYRACQGTGY